MLTVKNVRDTCQQNDWYTRGREGAFTTLAYKASHNWPLVDLAKDIQAHSVNADIEQIYKALWDLA